MPNLMHVYDTHINRRKRLIELVKSKHHATDGSIVLFSGFEADAQAFRQESSFYYLTGIVEPGIACVINLDGASTLYVPNYTIDRSVWVDEEIALTQDNATILGYDRVTPMGDPCAGFNIAPYASKKLFCNLVNDVVSKKCPVYSLVPDNADEYILQRLVCSRLFDYDTLTDISDIVADMRCVKDQDEIEELKKAIDVTMHAQMGASRAIQSGARESDVKAALEYVITQHQMRTSFPSIVATGVNGTILHYTACNKLIADHELVVVDIGAECDYYAADITRTYPVSGVFSQRQRELYQMVLDAQEYIASLAQPGYWLRNTSIPEKSLHHLAVAFFKERGYAEYFPHGIGHYLGIDVHDVGDYQKPLKEGNVITIEPGLYIRDEGIGIRIEDNYRITATGAECLSAAIPKTIEEIELLTLKN